MLKVVRDYWWVTLMLASMAMSYYVYEWWLDGQMGFAPSDAATLAGILLISIAFHEYGHWVMMHRYGLRPFMFILVIVGGAAPSDVEALKKLHRRQLAFIMLAGPLANLILLIVGLFLSHYTSWVAYGKAMSHINAGLIVFNLLPFGPLDGGRFVKLLFDSLDEKTDQLVSRMGAGATIIVALVMLGTGHFSLYPALLVTGVLRASTKDDPEAWRDERAMSPNVGWATFVVWLMMWGVAMACHLYLPSWLVQYPRV